MVKYSDMEMSYIETAHNINSYPIKKPIRAILGLGANLGDTEKTLVSAVECIKRLPRARYIRSSSMYVTEPVETPDVQPDYINMIVEIEADCSPFMILGMCLGIESAHMRQRLSEKAARTLDIDLIVCGVCGEEPAGHIILSTDELTLPHPRMMERGFVLVPLAELYPERKIFDIDFSDALKRCTNQRVRLFDKRLT